MGRLGRRVLAFLSAVALAVATGAVVTPPDDSGPPGRRTEVAGLVHSQADRPPGHSGFDRISRLRASEAGTGVTAAAGAATAAVPPGDTVIAPPPETFEEPAEPPSPPPRTLRPSRWSGVTPTGGTWALVIGINNYPGTRHDLRSAVADADDVNMALARLGVPAEHRVVLRDTQATRDTILAGLDWLTAHAGPDAVAVVFYAGHVRKVRGGVEAMVGADGKLLTDGELAHELTRLQARRAWIGIAACYAGGFTEVRAAGRILTGAAPANSLAYENAEFGRSYMVEYMVRRAMIEGRSDRSVEAAFGFAHQELERDYPNRLPVQYDWADGDLDLRPPGAPPPPPPDDGGSSGGGDSEGTSDSGSSGPDGSDGSGGSSSDEDEEEKDTCSSLTLIVSCRDD